MDCYWCCISNLFLSTWFTASYGASFRVFWWSVTYLLGDVLVKFIMILVFVEVYYNYKWFLIIAYFFFILIILVKLQKLSTFWFLGSATRRQGDKRIPCVRHHAVMLCFSAELVHKVQFHILENMVYLFFNLYVFFDSLGTKPLKNEKFIIIN